jgi:hypothetical protein
MLGINYLLNRINTYPISKERKQIEKNTIKNILHNNEYDTSIIDKSTQKQQKRKHQDRGKTPKK